MLKYLFSRDFNWLPKYRSRIINKVTPNAANTDKIVSSKLDKLNPERTIFMIKNTPNKIEANINTRFA